MSSGLSVRNPKDSDDIGWVGDVTSPGTSLFGKGFSSTGNSGAPVSRSSTNSCAVFVPCSTASLPLGSVTSAGGAALS
jgi:hypothetical protein